MIDISDNREEASFHLSDDLDLRLVTFDGRFPLVSCVLGAVVSNTSPRDVTEAVNGSL